MEKIYYTYTQSPVGKLMLAGNGEGLRYVGFQKGRSALKPGKDWVSSAEPFREASRQLEAYFAGVLREFDLPLLLEGTPFQLDVWGALREIPYGETVSYGEIARVIGKPKAGRAVGVATGRNPLPIIIPCHRVVGADGSLTGYGGGMPVKIALLILERASFRKG